MSKLRFALDLDQAMRMLANLPSVLADLPSGMVPPQLLKYAPAVSKLASLGGQFIEMQDPYPLHLGKRGAGLARYRRGQWSDAQVGAALRSILAADVPPEHAQRQQQIRGAIELALHVQIGAGPDDAVIPTDTQLRRALDAVLESETLPEDCLDLLGDTVAYALSLLKRGNNGPRDEG